MNDFLWWEVQASARLVPSEGSRRGAGEVQGRCRTLCVGAGRAFQRGPFAAPEDVTVGRGKGASRDRNPYRVHSKSKAEGGEEITELAVSVPPLARAASQATLWAGGQQAGLGGALFPRSHDGSSRLLSQVRIDFLNRQWTSSLVLGVITCPPERLNFPASACALKRAAWLLRGHGVFHNGLKVGGERGEVRGQVSEEGGAGQEGAGPSVEVVMSQT